MYRRCRVIGSWAAWFWLARIIRGRSQQVRTSRGVERPSTAMVGFKKDHPVSVEFFSQVMLKIAIVRLWTRTVGQSHFEGVYQAVGTSIIVGSRIFSIVRGLRFSSDHFHGCERWQLVGLVRHWLRRLKMLVEV